MDRLKHPLIKAILLAIIFFFLCFLWNVVYRQYIVTYSYRGDIFREGIHQAWLPFYMWHDVSQFHHILFVFASALMAWLVYYIFKRNHFSYLNLFLLISCSFLMSIAAAQSDGMERVSGAYAHIQTFANDLSFFSSVRDVLAYYIDRQSILDVHGQHYPPGLLLLLKSIGVTYTRVLIYIAGAGSVVLTFVVTTKITNQKSVGYCAAFIFATSSSFVVYTSLDGSNIIVFLMLLITLFLLRIIEQPNVLNSLLLAFFTAFAILFNFMLVIGLVILLVFLILEKRSALGSKHYIALISSVFIFLIIYMFMNMVFEFNIWSCLLQSFSKNMILNQSNGFDDLQRFFIRSSGNILAFILSAGVAVLFTSAKSSIILSRSLYIVILAAGFSGLFFGETERVWAILVPFVAIISAQYIHQLALKPILIIWFSILFTFVNEVFFKHFL